MEKKDSLNKNPLYAFLLKEGKKDLVDMLLDFSREWDKAPAHNPVLMKELHTSLSFKRKFAKYLVNRALAEHDFLVPAKSLDNRLDAIISYYVWTSILNNDLSKWQLHNLLYYQEITVGSGIWLKGSILNWNEDNIAPVTMSRGYGLYPAWRVFIVNTLCFSTNRFLMGIRCDSGPVRWQLYHKGCSPIDEIRKDSEGRVWTIIQIDSSLSDDHTAVFSNPLDGEGTLEICDYINDDDVRVVFRANY